jgi:hypothetical protein
MQPVAPLVYLTGALLIADAKLELAHGGIIAGEQEKGSLEIGD